MKFDSMSPATWEEDSIWEHLEWLRNNAPVYWDETNELWVLSKYADVEYVSKNNKLFCSSGGVRPNNPSRLSIIDMDEPRHTQLRGLIRKGFTPRMVGNLESAFRKIATDAIDKVAHKGECDFVLDISVPLPLELIAELIGIRKEDRATFHRWSDELIAADGNLDDPEIMGKATRAYAEYAEYLQEIFADRRANPRDDLISILVGAKEEGLLGTNTLKDGVKRIPGATEEDVALATDELLMFMVLLLVAGNETTRNAISGGIAQLIENPGERQKLIDDPSLMDSAVEEIVRHVTPVLNFSRSATEDTELRGTKIAKDQKVLMLYPGANRDPEVFDDPDAFKIDRNPNPHLGFGIGNHFCLGANLARMEIRVTLEEVLRRMPDMSYAGGPPKMVPSPLVRSFVSMPVTFTPEARGRTS